MMVPDHTPQIRGDTEGRYAGWAYAIGYMRALLRAVEAS
jgi:D-mannonate dehydratase